VSKVGIRRNVLNCQVRTTNGSAGKRKGEEPMTTKDEIMKALKNVEDPEIGMNIVDLGLIYGVNWDEEGGDVQIDLTLTSPGCPLGPEIIRDIKRALRAFRDVYSVDVDLVWQPMWHPSMMSEYAKDELGYDDELGLGIGY
jgi:metal-sulfur cluster biosynthetic enzyme